MINTDFVLLQPFSWHEDEENHETGINEGSQCKDHKCSLIEKLPDEWFSDSVEAHERVLTVAEQGNDGI